MKEAEKFAGGIYLCPNGKRIQELRTKRGWTQEELADQAECSKGTIENAEKGKRLRPGTLKLIADALQVPLSDLTSVEDTDPTIFNTLPMGEVASARVELTILVDYSRFSAKDEADLLAIIKATAGLTGEVRIILRGRGSVILTLGLSREDADRLCRAVREGALNDRCVVGYRRLPDFLESNPSLEGEVNGPSVVTCPRLPEEVQSETGETPRERKRGMLWPFTEAVAVAGAGLMAVVSALLVKRHG
jgi:transcriptional regulator with XRE-family HTH domain